MLTFAERISTRTTIAMNERQCVCINITCEIIESSSGGTNKNKWQAWFVFKIVNYGAYLCMCVCVCVYKKSTSKKIVFHVTLCAKETFR